MKPTSELEQALRSHFEARADGTVLDGQLDAERLAQPGDQADCLERMPSQGEEAVVDADPLDSEKLGSHSGCSTCSSAC